MVVISHYPPLLLSFPPEQRRRSLQVAALLYLHSTSPLSWHFFKKGIFKWKSLKAFKSFLVVLYGSCVGVIYQHLACNSFPFKLSFQYIKNLVVLKGAVRQDNDNYWFKRKEKNILLKVFLNNEYLWRNLKERRCKLFSNVKCFTFFLFCVFLAHSTLLKWTREMNWELLFCKNVNGKHSGIAR